MNLIYGTLEIFTIQGTSGGSTSAVTLSPSNGTSAQAVSATLSSFALHTVYHYRLTATSSGGSAATADAMFTTGNRAPVAVNDNGGSVSVGQSITIPVRANDSDADGDALTITSVSGATGGTVLIRGKMDTGEADIFTATLGAGNAATLRALQAAVGASVSGADGVVIDGLATASQTDPIISVQLDASGEFLKAWNGTIKGTGVTPADSHVIFTRGPSAQPPKLQARTGTQAAEAPAGAVWASFTSFALMNEVQPIFTAKLLTGAQGAAGPGGITTENDVGLWAMDSLGAFRLIVREGDSFGALTLKNFTVLTAVSGSPGQTRSFNDGG